MTFVFFELRSRFNARIASGCVCAFCISRLIKLDGDPSIDGSYPRFSWNALGIPYPEKTLDKNIIFVIIVRSYSSIASSICSRSIIRFTMPFLRSIIPTLLCHRAGRAFNASYTSLSETAYDRWTITFDVCGQTVRRDMMVKPCPFELSGDGGLFPVFLYSAFGLFSPGVCKMKYSVGHCSYFYE